MAQVLLSVPDMTCNHCVRRLEAILARRGEKGTIFLAEKRMQVETEDLPALLAELEEKGYPATLLS